MWSKKSTAAAIGTAIAVTAAIVVHASTFHGSIAATFADTGTPIATVVAAATGIVTTAATTGKRFQTRRR